VKLASALGLLALVLAASEPLRAQTPPRAPAPRAAPAPAPAPAQPPLPPSVPPSIPGEFSQPLVADLSSHLIAITTGFAGTELLLFGAIEGEGDVVVVLRGPPADTVVRRKGRILGVWINRESVAFTGIPSFYRVASTRPLAEVAPPALRQSEQIGVDVLRPEPTRTMRPDRLEAFRDGLARNKQRVALWDPEPSPVTFLGPRLFRTTIRFPANVPTGLYDVKVLLIRDGRVISGQTTPMQVSKVGVGADLYDFAHREAALYGLCAVLIAVAAGWGASVAFRRG